MRAPSSSTPRYKSSFTSNNPDKLKTTKKYAPLSFAVAIMITLRRLLAIWFIPPTVLCMILPLLVASCWRLLLLLVGYLIGSSSNKNVDNQNKYQDTSIQLATIFLILMTVGLTFLGRAAISMYAPTKQKALEAMQASALWLPSLALVVSSAFLHYLVLFISAIVGHSSFVGHHGSSWGWWPQVFRFFMQLTISMLLLGLSVVQRYMGPCSVVRCSAFPLVSHPFKTYFRSILTKCTSLDNFLDWLTLPTGTMPTTIPSISQTLASPRVLGRRFQGGEIKSNVLQVVSTLGLGWMASLALCQSRSLYQGDFMAQQQQQERHNQVVIISCIATCFVHLVFTCLDGKLHELDPLYYHAIIASVDSKTQFDVARRHLLTSSNLIMPLLIPLVLVPLVLMATNDAHDSSFLWGLFFPVTRSRENSTSLLEFLSLIFLTAWPVIIFTAIYLSAMDWMIKLSLLMPRLNLAKKCRELDPSFSLDTPVHVMIELLLFFNHNTTNQNQAMESIVYAPIGGIDKRRTIATSRSLEEDEMCRYLEGSKQMSNMMLHKDVSFLDGGIADDILRVLVLESLGGTDNATNDTNITVDSNPYLNAKDRHMANICKYIVSDNGDGIGGGAEHLVVPLLRAHCIYVGGMGMALEQMQQEEKSVTWAIPPGALSCLEWALVAAARCSVYALEGGSNRRASPHKMMGDDHPPSMTMMDWRSSHLSIFLRIVLEAAYTLRAGIEAHYAKKLNFPKTPAPQPVTPTTLRQVAPNSGLAATTTTTQQTTWGPQYRLVATCDAVAHFILEALQQQHQQVNGRASFKIDYLNVSNPKCHEWLGQLQWGQLTTTATPNRNSPKTLITNNSVPFLMTELIG